MHTKPGLRAFFFCLQDYRPGSVIVAVITLCPMKTKLIADSDIRDNVRTAMPGGLFAAVVLGFGSTVPLGLLPNIFGTNIVELLGETVGLGTIGFVGLVFSLLWYRLLLYMEYSAAIKYVAELKGDKLVVVGRSGRPIEFSPDDIKRIHFSGEYSPIIKGALLLRRDRTEFDNAFRSLMFIQDSRKKYKFGPFFLSIDLDSFASIVHELTLRNPDIKIT